MPTLEILGSLVEKSMNHNPDSADHLERPPNPINHFTCKIYPIYTVIEPLYTLACILC